MGNRGFAIIAAPMGSDPLAVADARPYHAAVTKTDGADGPDWLREAVVAIREEITRYVLAWGPFALFALTLAAGLRGLHVVSRVRAAIALLVTLAISGLLLRALHAAFDVGLRSPHFVLYFDHGIPMWDIIWWF